MEDGFIVIKNGFTKEKAAEWTESIWVRLGLDPNDKSTWDKDRIHMPWHRRENVASFAPKVCSAQCMRVLSLTTVGMGEHERTPRWRGTHRSV